MAQNKPIPLVGRLAIQLKMLTSAEVDRAVEESATSGNPRLAQVFLQLGLLDREQVGKLQKVQKDLVEKHRAKQGAGGAEPKAAAAKNAKPAAPAESAPPAAKQPPLKEATPASSPAAPSEEVHAAAAHAAEAASPMTSRDVDALHESPASPAPEASSLNFEIEVGTSESASEASGSAPAAAPEPIAEPSPAPPPVASPAPPASAAGEASAPAAAAVSRPEGYVSLELPVPSCDAADRERLESILSAGVSQSASDIHLHAGGQLKYRLNGELTVAEQSFDAETIERLVSASLTPEQRQVLGDDGELDFCLSVPSIGRFRANAYRQQRGLDVVFRSIPAEPPTIESLGLPEDLKKYTDYHQGMVLITGPAGCGKSSTLAALVNHINETRNEHILTVEDPIEIVHPSKKCLVNQRHAGHHSASFSRALRGALREDPDIIVIGELRDLETISLAMTAAETGHFVLATLHTANAVRTVNRMIGAFPSNEQDQVRAMLSESLRAVISQRLVPTSNGQGRIPALEMLVINRAIGNLVRDEKTVQIRSAMQTGKAHGMFLLEQSLNELVEQGKITRDVALEIAEEKKLITAGA
ncbi:MAG: type IV pilus twitching motility protein PilT [Myxococcota bacterium]